LFFSPALSLPAVKVPTREKVNDTVKELSGQKNVERFDQMKKDIDKINKQQADRLKESQ